jgi:hypothetical protein
VVSGSLHYDHRLEIPLLPEDSSCSLTPKLSGAAPQHYKHFIHRASAQTHVRQYGQASHRATSNTLSMEDAAETTRTM